MIINLPKYQRQSPPSPNVRPTSSFVGTAAYGNAKIALGQTVVRGIEAMSNAALGMYEDYHKRVADQVTTAVTLYKTSMTGFLESIENNPEMVSTEGDDPTSDIAGLKYQYSSKNAYMEHRKKTEEEVYKILTLSGARKQAQQIIEQIDRTYLEGLSEFDKKRNQELAEKRAIDNISVAVQNKDVHLLRNNISLYVQSGLIEPERGQMYLDKSLEQIAKMNLLDTYRSIVDAIGYEQTIQFLDNATNMTAEEFEQIEGKLGEEARGIADKLKLWYQTYDASDPNSTVATQRMLPLSVVGELKEVLKNDHEAWVKRREEMREKASETILSTFLDMIQDSANKNHNFYLQYVANRNKELKDAGLDELTWKEKTTMLNWLDAYTKRAGKKDERTAAQEAALKEFYDLYLDGYTPTEIVRRKFNEIRERMHPDDALACSKDLSGRDADVVIDVLKNNSNTLEKFFNIKAEGAKGNAEKLAIIEQERTKAYAALYTTIEAKKLGMTKEEYQKWVEKDLPKVIDGLMTSKREELTKTLEGENFRGAISNYFRKTDFTRMTRRMQGDLEPIVNDRPFGIYKTYAGDLLKNSKLFEYIIPQVRVTKDGFPVFQVQSKAIFGDDTKRFVSIRADEEENLYLVYGTDSDETQWKNSKTLDQYKPIASGSSPSGSSGSNATKALGPQSWEPQNPPEDLAKAIDKAKTGKMFSVQVQNSADATGMTVAEKRVPIYDYQKIQDEAFKKKIKEETKAREAKKPRDRSAEDSFLYNGTLFYVDQFVNVPKN